jgi:hypothetical protein
MAKTSTAKTSTDETTKSFAPFEQAYYEYVRELSTIAHELNSGVFEAQKAGAPAPRDEPAAIQEKSRGYNEAVQTAWEASQKRYTQAYFDFLDKFGSAWMAAEKSHMAPPAMAMLAQSAMVAAGHAATTIGNMDVFGWSGAMPKTGGGTS